MGLILRLLVVAGLAVDAYIHFHLAGNMGSSGGGLSEGTLFWVQGVVAALVAVLVLVRATRLTYAIAFLVAASALGAVLLYRYVDVGPLGPLQNMYEPVWYTEKVVTTVAEAVATVAAALGLWHVSARERVGG
ncbi:hypothetical protein NE236_05090 [Actinoallomurus purpureus]|uniref:hypothetical protein n=1 Tax=Actinoallomurus purpureus TaxID=478114 RepID=UPI002092420D|nr:hypothetical protein [Actinoallomurus purpureus]MCO6004350.1 hypothetical protein [Actinoallomurus purpureus]